MSCCVHTIRPAATSKECPKEQEEDQLFPSLSLGETASLQSVTSQTQAVPGRPDLGQEDRRRGGGGRLAARGQHWDGVIGYNRHIKRGSVALFQAQADQHVVWCAVRLC